MKSAKSILPSAGLVIAMALMAACSTPSINSTQPISIPSGLTTQDVKLAIIYAIYPGKTPTEWSHIDQMTDNALKAAFPFTYSKVDRSENWFLEEIRSGSVLIGFDDGDHYLRVEYVIDRGRIIQRIDGSRNLGQTGETIKKDAFEFLGAMESKIRQSMGILSAMKAESDKKPQP
jgi:hypothetical protein